MHKPYFYKRFHVYGLRGAIGCPSLLLSWVLLMGKGTSSVGVAPHPPPFLPLLHFPHTLFACARLEPMRVASKWSIPPSHESLPMPPTPNRRHHEFTQPFSLTGEIAHPVEFMFNFLVPLMAGPFLLAWTQGVHVVTFWIWCVRLRCYGCCYGCCCGCCCRFTVVVAMGLL